MRVWREYGLEDVFVYILNFTNYKNIKVIKLLCNVFLVNKFNL